MNVVLLQTTVPSYRLAVIDALAERLGGRLSVVSGRDDFAPGVKLAPHPLLTLVSNVYFARRRALWQRGSVRPALRADVVLLDLNPRILSYWAIIVLRRLIGRRTVLWGHAWPRRGPDARSDRLRQVMRRLGSAIAVYTETEAVALRPKVPNTQVVAAPNGLYRREFRGAARGDSPPTDIVFIGRLSPAKKPELFLAAFLSVVDDLPEGVRAVFVGDGDLRPQLEREAERAGPGRVAFLGEVTEFEELKRIYANAIASVSPGYVGLSLIQSLWFGVPELIARDEPHSPEIEAAVEGETCLFFDSDSPTAMGEAIAAVVARRGHWLARREELAEWTAARYSVDALVDGLMSVLVDGAR